MKHLFSRLFLLYIYFSVFISSIKTEDSQQNEFHHIIDGSLNGTAKYVSLTTISKNKQNLFFTFDFSYHYDTLTTNKDTTYFKLTTPIEFINKNNPYLTKTISFIFSKKKWSELKTVEDLKLKKIYWIPARMIYYQKDNYSNFEYYIEVKRFFNEHKTLILKVPISGQTTGDITVENLVTLPENIQNLAKNNYFNRHFYGNDINTRKNNLYGNNYQYQHHHHSRYQYGKGNQIFTFSGWAAILGAVLGQIWIVILVLYCLVNRRKKNITGFSVVVNDGTNQRNANVVQ